MSTPEKPSGWRWVNPSLSVNPPQPQPRRTKPLPTPPSAPTKPGVLLSVVDAGLRESIAHTLDFLDWDVVITENGVIPSGSRPFGAGVWEWRETGGVPAGWESLPVLIIPVAQEQAEEAAAAAPGARILLLPLDVGQLAECLEP